MKDMRSLSTFNAKLAIRAARSMCQSYVMSGVTPGKNYECRTDGVAVSRRHYHRIGNFKLFQIVVAADHYYWPAH